MVWLIPLAIMSCKQRNEPPTAEISTRILFLHHSTGGNIWRGNNPSWYGTFGIADDVPAWFASYNKVHGTGYHIEDRIFPKDQPYGWHNYPYDYYNIWVRNAGDSSFMEEPTLEMLTREYDLIIWKHCFPVSNVKMDEGDPDIGSDQKTIQNYKLQYEALRNKMHEFPDTRFIVWTGAAQVEEKTDAERAERARSFFNWVKETWDEPGDNIFLWDFRQLETGGNLYLEPKNAASASNSHPNRRFSGYAAKLFCQRIVDVIENSGTKTDLTGNPI